MSEVAAGRVRSPVSSTNSSRGADSWSQASTSSEQREHRSVLRGPCSRQVAGNLRMQFERKSQKQECFETSGKKRPWTSGNSRYRPLFCPFLSYVLAECDTPVLRQNAQAAEPKGCRISNDHSERGTCGSATFRNLLSFAVALPAESRLAQPAESCRFWELKPDALPARGPVKFMALRHRLKHSLAGKRVLTQGQDMSLTKNLESEHVRLSKDCQKLSSSSSPPLARLRSSSPGYRTISICLSHTLASSL